MQWFVLIALGYFLLKPQTSAAGQVNIFQAAPALLASALQVWRFDPRGNAYDTQFTATEQANNLPAGLLRRVAWQESRFDPSAVSSAGAIGLMQFMPMTASAMGFDPLDPIASITYAGSYLAGLYKTTGSWAGALASYNWGLGNYLSKGMSAAPAETQQYVVSITSDLGIA